MRHDIYLIPGFFGFADLGEVRSFHHVESYLSTLMAERGIDANIVAVETAPNASLPSRARILLEHVRHSSSSDDTPIHFIGHSTGALDARLFVTPGWDASSGGCLLEEAESYQQRVETVVSLAGPHFGTPTASFFDGFFG